MAASILILAGLAFIVVFAIGGVVIVLLSQRQKLAADQERMQEFVKRQESAIWAGATIVSARGGVITGSEVGVSQRARYELSLQVTPPGGAPYLAHTNWLVDVGQISLLQPGKQVSVKIDQQDPQIIYPASGGATYLPG